MGADKAVATRAAASIVYQGRTICWIRSRLRTAGARSCRKPRSRGRGLPEWPPCCPSNAFAAGATQTDVDILGAAEIAEALAVTTYTNIINNAPFFKRLEATTRGT